MASIRMARPEDRAALARMRHALWPDGSEEEHAQEVDAVFAGHWSRTFPYVLLIAQSDDGTVIGFADVTMRSFADGCDPSHPVGYLEGWFVDESYRRQGVGASLVRAAEDWARQQGCREFASDTWLDHLEAQRAHEALGFELVDRVVNYRKAL